MPMIARDALPNALITYQKTKMAAVDPTHTEWLHEIFVHIIKIGDVPRAQVYLFHALIRYQKVTYSQETGQANQFGKGRVMIFFDMCLVAQTIKIILIKVSTELA